MIKEGNQTVTKCDSFKMLSKDGKMRQTDTLDMEGIFRLIESVPSSKAEPFKLNRHKLTDVWKDSGITENYEYGILTNEIYKSCSGMKSNEYKAYKNIRKESLRDNMTDIEVALTDLGEIATRELVKEHKPYGLSENKEIARRGGNIAKMTRDNLENELGYQYIDDAMEIEEKVNIGK